MIVRCLSEIFQNIKILNNLNNISQNLVKLSRAKLNSMKITHPKAAELSYLRIQKLLLKLSMKIMTKNVCKQCSSIQNQRQILENNIITFSLRTFLMNGQRPRSKYVLVFSVLFPTSL